MTHKGMWRIYSNPDPHGGKKSLMIAFGSITLTTRFMNQTVTEAIPSLGMIIHRAAIITSTKKSHFCPKLSFSAWIVYKYIICI
jgi:hypothetical protein